MSSTIHVNTAAVHKQREKEALFRMVPRKGQKGDPFC